MIVVADSQGLVPDTDRANDQSASASPILISVPTLPTSGSVTGTIAAGKSLLYQLSLPAQQNVTIAASTSNAGVVDLYEQYQTPPTSAAFDHEDVYAGSSSIGFGLDDTQAGTYYILVTGTSLAGSGTSFTLSDTVAGFTVTRISPDVITPIASAIYSVQQTTATFAITGTGFTPSTTVKLVGGEDGFPVSTLTPVSTTFVNSTTIWATFDDIPVYPEYIGLGVIGPVEAAAVGVESTPASDYGVVVSNGAQEASGEPLLTVNPEPDDDIDGVIMAEEGITDQPSLSVSVSAPSTVRPDQVAIATITYTNESDADMPAPLLLVSVSNGAAQAARSIVVRRRPARIPGVQSQRPRRNSPSRRRRAR